MKKLLPLALLLLCISSLLSPSAKAMSPAPFYPSFTPQGGDDDGGGGGIPVITPVGEGLGDILSGVGKGLERLLTGAGDQIAGAKGIKVGDIEVSSGDVVDVPKPPTPEPPAEEEVDKWEDALDRVGGQIDKILDSGVPPEQLGTLLDKLLDTQGDIIDAKADADGSGGGDDGGGDDGGSAS